MWMMFLIGVCAFLLAGMGLGGGLLLIPALSLFAGASPETARYTALIGYLPAALAVAWRFAKSRALYSLAPLWSALLAGALTGACCSLVLPARVLYRFFGVFMAACGVRMLLFSRKTFRERAAGRPTR